jgi:dihydropteroate synthase
LEIQFIDIYYPNVFRIYSAKYNIFRDLYEKDLTGLEIRGVDYKLAQNVKRIILSNKEICYHSGDHNKTLSDILVLGNYGIFRDLAKEIKAIGNEDLGFRISNAIKNITDYDSSNIQIGNKIFSLNTASIAGILNITPDSFSDGGKYFSKKAAVEHGIKLLEDGADILDIGGESSRPDSLQISEEEELNRVIPVIEEILKLKPEALLSIDTTKSNVAIEALKRGAKIVNDISSFDFDNAMIDAVKKFNASIILMHMKGNPLTMQISPEYEDVVSEIYDYLLRKVETVRKSGIKNIIIDPGIGFGKSVADNYELIKRLNELKGIGQPIMIGISKKSLIGKSLNLEICEREIPSLVAETIAIKKGARFIRTHNVINAVYASKLNSYIENPEQLLNV